MTSSLQLFQSLTVMQKALFRYWIVLWLVAACLFLYPINTLPLRVLLLASLLGVWAGCFLFGRRQKLFCAALLVFTFMVIGFLISPGKECDRKQLRDSYV